MLLRQRMPTEEASEVAFQPRAAFYGDGNPLNLSIFELFAVEAIATWYCDERQRLRTYGRVRRHAKRGRQCGYRRAVGGSACHAPFFGLIGPDEGLPRRRLRSNCNGSISAPVFRRCRDGRYRGHETGGSGERRWDGLWLLHHGDQQVGIEGPDQRRPLSLQLRCTRRTCTTGRQMVRASQPSSLRYTLMYKVSSPRPLLRS